MQQLHTSMVGDDVDLVESDPAAEYLWQQNFAALQAQQNAEHERDDVMQEIAFLIHKREMGRIAKSIGPHPRGAGRPRAQASRSSSRSGDSGDDDPEPGPTEWWECPCVDCTATGNDAIWSGS